MTLSEVGPVTIYRTHTPRWATAPTNGAGSATHGGRANSPGTPAPYLALEPLSAISEYQQLSPLLPPGTLVSCTVYLAPVVDFRAGYDANHWSGLWEEFHGDRRELWLNQRMEPPSWVLGEEAQAAGAKGILFASTLAPGGSSLVVFSDQLTASDVLQVDDPADVLPKDQNPWCAALFCTYPSSCVEVTDETGSIDLDVASSGAIA